jgi:hypothetical protein
MYFELFENDGSRWLCENINARIRVIILAYVGIKKKKKKKNSLLCGTG